MPSWWDMAYISGAPWDSNSPPAELVEFVEKGRIEPGTALDVGCGTGTAVIYLASVGFEAHGLDISRIAIGKAKKKAADKKVKCAFHRLDFTDPNQIVASGIPAFDFLMDRGCFHSLSPQDRKKYVGSLGMVSVNSSIFLMWCFLRNLGIGFGPPGVEWNEVEDYFSRQYQILEKRELESFRKMLFYIMRKK